MTAAEVLRAAIPRLAAAGVEDPARDARRLLAHALGLAPGRLVLALQEPLPAGAEADFAALIARRVSREPVAHLTGARAFYGRQFIVTAAVLDPRPETETLVAAALGAPFVRVLDLGTGSGCILLSLLAERPDATGLGVDLSAAACAVARANAAAMGLAGRAEIVTGNWAEGLTGPFDLIVANPPYIAADDMAALAPEVRLFEPGLALSPGGDGLDAYRAIMPRAAALLCPGGRILVEIGPTQGPAVAALMAAAGLDDVSVMSDLDGRDRVVGAIRPR